MAMSATVKGGFFPTNGVTTLTPISVTDRGWSRRQVSRILAKRGMQAIRQLAIALDGVAPGGTAQKFNVYVGAAGTELGGKRPVQQNVIINRATTAGDVTEINADLFTYSERTTFGASPVANKDGNPLGTR